MWSKAKCQVFWMYSATWLYRETEELSVVWATTHVLWFNFTFSDTLTSALVLGPCVCGFRVGATLNPMQTSLLFHRLEIYHWSSHIIVYQRFPSITRSTLVQYIDFFMCCSSLCMPVLTSKLDWSNPFVLSALSIWHPLKSFLYVKCICYVCLPT